MVDLAEHGIKSTDNPSILNAFEAFNSDKPNAFLARMLVLDSRPVSMVDSAPFLKFVQSLRPAYKPLCRQTMADKLKLMADAARVELKKQLQPVSITCSVSTDGWLSPTGSEFICAVCHYIDTDWNLRYHLLEVLPMSGDTTADMLRTQLLSIFDKYAIRPHTIVSDQAANISKAIKDMRPNGTSRLVCVAHNLNLVVNDTTDLARGMEDLNGMRSLALLQIRSHYIVSDSKTFAKVFTDLMQKAKGIVGYHAHSAKRAEELKQSQLTAGLRPGKQTLKLIRDVPTRWNSRYDLLERLINLDSALRQYIPNELRLNQNELIIISDVCLVVTECVIT